jgi:hypothetical protein
MPSFPKNFIPGLKKVRRMKLQLDELTKKRLEKRGYTLSSEEREIALEEAQE